MVKGNIAKCHNTVQRECFKRDKQSVAKSSVVAPKKPLHGKPTRVKKSHKWAKSPEVCNIVTPIFNRFQPLSVNIHETYEGSDTVNTAHSVTNSKLSKTKGTKKEENVGNSVASKK